MRVLSWRGRRVSFSDSICPSCADRVRIEGLWGSPPPPVWPGSPQTALIFVGLPLLTALVLLAAPLHDAAPLPPREETIAVTGRDLTEPEPGLADRTVVAAMPRAVARRSAKESAVPAVIYETRRRVDRPRELARAATGGADRITATPARARSRAAAAALGTPPSSLGTQSP